MNNLFPNSKKIIVLIIVLAVVLLGSFILRLNSRTVNTLLPPVSLGSPEPSAGPVAPTVQKTPPVSLQTKIGITTKDQLLTSSDIASSSALTRTKTLFTFRNTDTLQAHSVVEYNGVAAFEKGTLIQPGLKLHKISEYIAQFGSPDKIYTGSRRFGQFENTYIYASKGFALVGNHFTDEVDQLQSFTPTTTEQYVLEWGQDIEPDSGIKETF